MWTPLCTTSSVLLRPGGGTTGGVAGTLFVLQRTVQTPPPSFSSSTNSTSSTPSSGGGDDEDAAAAAAAAAPGGIAVAWSPSAPPTAAALPGESFALLVPVAMLYGLRKATPFLGVPSVTLIAAAAGAGGSGSGSGSGANSVGAPVPVQAVVPQAGAELPPLCFAGGGMDEFLAVLGSAAPLGRSPRDANVLVFVAAAAGAAGAASTSSSSSSSSSVAAGATAAASAPSAAAAAAAVATSTPPPPAAAAAAATGAAPSPDDAEPLRAVLGRARLSVELNRQERQAARARAAAAAKEGVADDAGPGGGVGGDSPATAPVAVPATAAVLDDTVDPQADNNAASSSPPAFTAAQAAVGMSPGASLLSKVGALARTVLDDPGVAAEIERTKALQLLFAGRELGAPPPPPPPGATDAGAAAAAATAAAATTTAAAASRASAAPAAAGSTPGPPATGPAAAAAAVAAAQRAGDDGDDGGAAEGPNSSSSSSPDADGTIKTELGSFDVLADVDSARSSLREAEARAAQEPQHEVSVEEFVGLFDAEGRLTAVEPLVRRVLAGGLAPDVRPQGWKFLLGVYPWTSTLAEREAIDVANAANYARWRDMWQFRFQEAGYVWSAAGAEATARATAPGIRAHQGRLLKRIRLIEKDVARTDRKVAFYMETEPVAPSPSSSADAAAAGDGEDTGMCDFRANPMLVALRDILITYAVYNEDVGYAQGMNELLSPILAVVGGDQPAAFACFIGLMQHPRSLNLQRHFSRDQVGMTHELEQLSQLVKVFDAGLHEYLESIDATNFFFAFRWLLICFKREFSFFSAMRLWECCWAHAWLNSGDDTAANVPTADADAAAAEQAARPAAARASAAAAAAAASGAGAGGSDPGTAVLPSEAKGPLAVAPVHRPPNLLLFVALAAILNERATLMTLSFDMILGRLQALQLNLEVLLPQAKQLATLWAAARLLVD